ncbi:MAG: LysR family transcriptional regulator [Rhodospirillaceae bacterium]|jgi:LysR family nitrogen assimilation transcriptional regulator|nr:LysR family transcriptional regulator [Rhodospirillaceae bacterium]MBT5457123.1 LysR family transcriptional regulator [Rhodospirillaceae bacterium]
MDIRQLRYFVSAVDVGSVTNAAHQLNISQPALGLQIRKLEDELGSPLLTRHSRGVSLTPAGEKLYEHATLILRQTERATQDIRGFAGPPSGRVSIGLTPTASLLLAASLVERCRAELPNLAIRISDGHGDQNLALLSADRLDLALSYASDDNRDIEFIPLVTEELFLISPPGPVSSAATDVPFHELANAPLILPSRPNILSTLLEDAAQSTQTPLDIMYELDSMEPKKEMVIRGLGLTVLPYGSVQKEVADGLLTARRIIEPDLTRTLYLARARQHPRSKARDALEALPLRLVANLCETEDWHWRLAPGST